MSYANTALLGVEHTRWLGTLDFYDKELDILENRLQEVAFKNTGTDARAGVEHFQNQFIVQRNNIDELQHEINKHAHAAYKDASTHAGHVEEGLLVDHKVIEDKMATFEKLIEDLRHEFNVFLSKWM